MATDDNNQRPGGPAPVRIGDAERQRMTELLQRHMAAGRLDMPEYERRVEHATAAVYEQDLDGLLDDLPPIDEDGEPVRARERGRRPTSEARDAWQEPAWWPNSGGRGGSMGWRRRPFPLPFPMLAIGAIALVIATHGWILFPILFLVFFARGGGCGTRHHRAQGPRQRWEHPSAEHGGTRSWGEEDRPRWPGSFVPSDDDQRL